MSQNFNVESYQRAQHAISELKTAIFMILMEHSEEGLRNVEIGKKLGINMGHKGRHDGYIPRAMLDMMETEGTVEQYSNQKWRLCVDNSSSE